MKNSSTAAAILFLAESTACLLEILDVAVGHVKGGEMRQILRHKQDIHGGVELTRKGGDPGQQGFKVRSKINGEREFF